MPLERRPFKFQSRIWSRLLKFSPGSFENLPASRFGFQLEASGIQLDFYSWNLSCGCGNLHASKALPSASAGVNEKNLRGFKLRLASSRPDGRHSALSYWQFGVSKELRYLAPSEVVRRKRKFRFPELEGPVEARNAQKSLFLNAPKFKRRTAELEFPSCTEPHGAKDSPQT